MSATAQATNTQTIRLPAKMNYIDLTPSAGRLTSGRMPFAITSTALGQSALVQMHLGGEVH